jgi:hypothetical protein
LILNELTDFNVYAVSLELILNNEKYDSDTPTILLSKPFLINFNSDPLLLSEYSIVLRLNSSIMFKLSEDDLINSRYLIKYSKIT